jgi:hypothetical protein
MPYAVVPHSGAFAVVNTETGRVHAKHTTKEKAVAQMRLLYGIEHGMKPRKK